MTNLDGETVIVTGASMGLGRSMAVHLATCGANVALIARNEDKLDAVTEEIADIGESGRGDGSTGEPLVVPADVRDADAVDSAVSATIDRFGAVDTLINNAGLSALSFGEERRQLVEIDEDEWDRILDVNVKGVYLCTRRVLEAQVERGSGNVVNISSGLGRMAVPGATAYVTSKWGLEGFTRAVSMEVESEGINVNAMSPGGQVNTRIWSHLPDEQRENILQPDVMNEAAALLAAQGADGVTGESMTAAEWEHELG